MLWLCWDVMQDLPLPSMLVQEFVYLSQLQFNVFCIHYQNIELDNSHIGPHYYEGTAEKGVNEVCSFLNKCIQKYVLDTVKILHTGIYSDLCVGQNKNHPVINFLVALITLAILNRLFTDFVSVALLTCHVRGILS